MKLPTSIVLPLVICMITTIAQRTILDKFTGVGRIFRQFLNNAYDREARTSQYARDLKESQRAQNVVNSAVPFPCSLTEPRSKERPTSVHMLRPGDIDVIGAIGDSLTAGYGALATSFFNLFREYRGASFAIGGEKTWREETTIPNILKEFNPNLIGYALAASSSIDKKSQFNVAESGAVSADTIHMTKVLIKRIASDKRVNLASDWKMINICIGANDFCLQSCYERNPAVLLDRHRKNLVQVLRLIRDNLPKTFVNIIPPPNVNLLKQFKNKPKACYTTHVLSCGCIMSQIFQPLAPVLEDVIVKWQLLEEEIANYEEFDTDDFTVVVQPIFDDPVLPLKQNGDVDYTFFALDCFHFSQRGHARVATNLWNDIITPVGQKQRTMTFDGSIKCPNDKSPYLYTNKNSRLH